MCEADPSLRAMWLGSSGGGLQPTSRLECGLHPLLSPVVLGEFLIFLSFLGAFPGKGDCRGEGYQHSCPWMVEDKWEEAGARQC